jgi:hypothetical protein
MSAQQKLDKFMLLYDDAMKRKQRKDNIYSKCLDSEWTFHPELFKGRRYESFISEDGNFVERLSKPSNAKNRSKIRQLADEKFDKSTGQRLFHPKVGRPPLVRKDDDNLPVSEKLYNESKKRALDKEQAEFMRNNSQKRIAVQEKSEELLDHKKARKFHEIFLLLDSDNDGIISAEKIDISRLSHELLEIFTPLFWEMEDLEQTLDLEEFIDASMRLYDTLGVPEKSIILSLKDKWGRVKSTNEKDWTFQPKLNKNSLKIAAKWRDEREDVVNKLYKKKFESEARLDEMRRQKEEEELIGCTFQPKLSTNSPFRSDYERINIWEEHLQIQKPTGDSFSVSSMKNSDSEKILYDEYDRYHNYEWWQ